VFWITSQIAEVPELQEHLWAMLVNYMDKENEVREAQVVKNASLVQERRVAYIELERERLQRKKIEDERDAAQRGREIAEHEVHVLKENLDIVQRRLEDIDRKLGSLGSV
jgi:hypothetical protein